VQALGGVAAVIRNPHLEHFQYVNPHWGQISPTNLPEAVCPQWAHVFSSWFFSIFFSSFAIKDSDAHWAQNTLAQEVVLASHCKTVVNPVF
jgi:hypothetical protein